MKTNYQIQLILLFCCSFLTVSSLFAQTDSMAFSYYPLQNGDCWQYRVTQYEWLVPSWNTSYKTILVTADTILPDLDTYRILSVTDDHMSGFLYQYNRYERVDSISGNVYLYIFTFEGGRIYLIDSLHINVGDTLTGPGSRENVLWGAG